MNDTEDSKMDEIEEMYSERGFFARLGDMFRGFKAPAGSKERRVAEIELQRLLAPMTAMLFPTLVIIVLCVVTMVSSKTKPPIRIDIQMVEDDPTVLVEIPEDPTPPDDPEPVDIEIMMDAPPSPTMDAPVDKPMRSDLPESVKPAPLDAVMMVKSPVKMKNVMSSRTPGRIGSVTGGGATCGDPTTEVCVLKVLWWLKAHQNSDGSWGNANQVANTSLALLTYLAHGEYPGSESPYRKDFGPVVQSAADYLISHMKEDASKTWKFFPTDGNEYSFLLGTYALCETYGMTHNPDVRYVALKGLQRIIDGQSATGGWDYKLNKNSTRDDLSFAGWAIQALKAGKLADLHPDGLDEAVSKAVKCLKTRNYSASSGFTYTPTANNNGGSTGLAGVGALAMQLLGRGAEKEVSNALNVMREWTPAFDPGSLAAKKPGGSPQYYCYYATQCKYQAGLKANATKADDAAWRKWNLEMKKLYTSSIIDVPELVPDWTGKGHKQGYFENKDTHSSRPYMDTCLAALQLMVYYRYLPTTSLKASEVEVDINEAAKDAGEVGVDVGF